MWLPLIVIAVITIGLIVFEIANSGKNSISHQPTRPINTSQRSMESPFHLGIEHTLVKKAEETFYEILDRAWAGADTEYYDAFKNNDKHIRLFLYEKSFVLLNVDPSSERAQMFMTFIMFQGFAYSYYLVNDLEKDFEGFVEKSAGTLSGSVENVTVALTEVLADRGYLIGCLEREGFDNKIKRMTEEKDEIVRETKKRMTNG